MIPSICFTGSERSLDGYDSVDRNNPNRIVRVTDYCDRGGICSMYFIDKIFSTINMDMGENRWKQKTINDISLGS